MTYTQQQFEKVIEDFGEVFFVLDSDREYIVHGKRGYEFTDFGDQRFVEIEGMSGNEYNIVQFPLEAIEHHYTHKEV